MVYPKDKLIYVKDKSIYVKDNFIYPKDKSGDRKFPFFITFQPFLI